MAETLAYELIARDINASRTFDHLGDAIDDAGKSTKTFEGQQHSLSKQITETETHLKGLIQQIDGTENKELFKAIRKDQSLIAFLKKAKKELEEVADQAEAVAATVVSGPGGRGFMAGFVDALSGLPSQLKGAGIVGGIALAPLIAAPVGAALAGAVLGAAGAGGIVGGVIAAAQDERVKMAGATLTQNFLGGFKDAGRIFITPVLDQMSTLQRTEDVVLADLAAGFAKLAPAVRPFAQGLEGLAENLDLDKILGDALPAIRAIGNELPEIGAAISDGLGAISDESDGAVEGLIATMHAVEDLIRGGGEFVGWLAGVFDWLVRTDKALTQWALDALDVADSLSFLTGGATIAQLGVARDHLQGVNDEMNSLVDSLGDANDAGRDWRGNLSEQARAAKEAANEAKDYTDALEKLFGIQMNLDEAQIAYQRGLDETAETLKDGKKTLDINSKAGQDNAQAILSQVKNIERLRQANIDNGMAVEDANAAAKGQIDALVEMAVRIGFARDRVHELVDAYVDAQKNAYISTHVEDDKVQAALTHVRNLEAEMARLNGNVATVYVRSVYDNDYRRGERNPSGRAGGGMVMAGRGYTINEEGPELVEFGRNGRVIPAGASAAMMRGASAPAAAAPTQILVSAKPGVGQLLVELIQFEVGTAGAGDVNYLAGRR